MITTLAIEHIVSDPNMHDGKPYVAGKGITVHYIAQLYNLDWTTMDLAEEFELTPGQVHAALSYYFDHKSDIDRDILAINQATDAFLGELTRQGTAISADELRRRIGARK
jgi:uncharacterized protein (DUF433 family)